MGLTTEDSLSQTIDRAVKRYSSLFKLPSYARVVVLLALICIGGGLISTAALFPSVEGLLRGLLLGSSLFLLNLVSSYVISTLVLRGDAIYDLRRTVALSLFCWMMWLIFIIMGVAAAIPFGLRWWVRLCLLGFAAVVILRLIVFDSTSRKSYGRRLIASLLQPFACAIPFLVFWAAIPYPLTAYMLLYFVFSLGVSIAASHFLLSTLNRVGQQTLGVPSMSLLKAFLLNWIMDLNAPLEELLENLGEEQDVKVSLMKFGSSKPKAVMVIPSVHPGPFKNVGSSALPSMLKSALERKLGCVVCVPHGLFGHELDLASQAQNQKLINRILESTDFEAAEAKATPFVTFSNGAATACCQIFGKFVFVSFTLAPKTTEDLPQDLGLYVREEAEKRGLTCSGVVNAHNSIDGVANMQESLDELKAVAVACLEKAVLQERVPFQVGAATVIPEEFTIREGMGPGGITTIVVKVGKQKTAYIVIDGNNMVSGLREKVLLALHSLGIDDGEVFTTDTHAVSAVILSQRGYNAVGEAIDHERLIAYVKEATAAAMSNLESVKAASCCNITVPNVKVIGKKRLETLCLLVDRAIQKAKRIVVPIFGISGLFLMLILLFV
jgi:putative membrane protein